MITVERISAIAKAHNLTPTALGRLINVAQPKMSKVMSGSQTLPTEAIGELIRIFHIHPNWIFGYEGNPSEVMYMKDLVHKSELEKKEEEKLELERENAKLYKELASHYKQQAAESSEKYEASKKTVEELKNS